jgi:hypothetical protein
VYIFDQVASGNVPSFLRTMVTITVTGIVGGSSRTAQYAVIPDYLAVGSDTDFFRMPMTPILAQWLCDRFNCTMPTRKMVDDIWSRSAHKLAPQPIAPSADMITVPVFYTHHQMVESQRVTAGAPLGALISGIKKDVVITPQLPTRPAPPRVAIYGWHYQSGTAIQPLSLVHENTYADYSHGIRLVNNSMLLDGVPTTVQAVLANPDVAGLLSDEGAFSAGSKYPTSSAPGVFPYIDRFLATGRELYSWTDRFTSPTIISFSPTAPGGDGSILRVRDAGGGIDTTRTGQPFDAAHYVECYIYCNYRPALSSDGYERVGIFVRDNGNGMFEGISGGGSQGNNYSLTWDSHNGRVQCLRTVAGVPTDMLPSAVYRASSGWRLMRIEGFGSQLTFKLDGDTLLSASDATHAKGQFGIGFHEYFNTNSNLLGTYGENFSADRLPPAGITNWEAY